MSLSIAINGAAVDLGVPPSSIRAATAAEMGEVAYGALTVEDDDALLTITGHKAVSVGETDCSQPLLFRGWVGPRGHRRDPENAEIVDVSRIFDVTLLGLGALFGFRMVKGTDGNRPEESWDARLAWILASNYLAGTSGALVEDTGYTMSSALTMDAADYRGQYPSTVMDDLCDRFGGTVNYYAFWDPAASKVSLYIGPIDDGWSDATISISNDLADVDGISVFPPDSVATLERNPDQVYSEVTVEYAHGTIFRTRPTTAIAYIRRGTRISRPYIGKAATAIAAAEKFLDRHATESDKITTTINVPPAAAGLIVAGQRVFVTFTHLPGYAAGAWMRCVSNIVSPQDDACLRYTMQLELVGPKPVLQECVTAVTFSDLVVTPSPTYGGPSEYLGGAGNWPNVDVTPDAGAACVVIGAFVASNWNVPGDEEPSAAGAGYTKLHSGNAYDGHPEQVVVYKAVASASGSYTPTGTYVPGYGYSTTSVWAMAGLAIYSGDSAPVQDAWAVHPLAEFYRWATFPGAVTAGNAILMVTFHRDWYSFGFGGVTPVPYPNDGQWVLLGHTAAWKTVEFTSADAVYVWARCVAAGDGTTYGLESGNDIGAVSISLSEWTATGSADTSTDLGPITVQTTTHTIDPTVTDDGDAGFPVGSVWVNTTSGDVFVSVDATDGAAVWTPITGSAIGDPPGYEYDYAQITAATTNLTHTTEATADTIVTGNAVAYDGSTAVIIEFFTAGVVPDNGAAGRSVLIWLYDGSSSIGALGGLVTPSVTAALQVPVCLRTRITPSAATHTYSIRGTTSAGTAVIDSGAGGTGVYTPTYLRITKV